MQKQKLGAPRRLVTVFCLKGWRGKVTYPRFRFLLEGKSQFRNPVT